MTYPKNPKYTKFDPRKNIPQSYDDILEILDIFLFEFEKKECGMRERDEKWAGGLRHVRQAIEMAQHNQIKINKIKELLAFWKKHDYQWTSKHLCNRVKSIAYKKYDKRTSSTWRHEEW